MLYTILRDNDVNVTINIKDLLLPIIFRSPKTQRIFNEAITESVLISHQSWATDRKSVITGTEIQVDIGSALIINAPLCSIAAKKPSE